LARIVNRIRPSVELPFGETFGDYTLAASAAVIREQIEENRIDRRLPRTRKPAVRVAKISQRYSIPIPQWKVPYGVRYTIITRFGVALPALIRLWTVAATAMRVAQVEIVADFMEHGWGIAAGVSTHDDDFILSRERANTASEFSAGLRDVDVDGIRVPSVRPWIIPSGVLHFVFFTWVREKVSVEPSAWSVGLASAADFGDGVGQAKAIAPPVRVQ
jgi:hypothetical protein